MAQRGTGRFVFVRTASLNIIILLLVHSATPANRTWSAFVPLCGLKFIRSTVIMSRARYFSYLHNSSNIANITYIACRCLRTARSTSSECAFLLHYVAASVYLYWAGEVCTLSVCLSVCLSGDYDLLETVMPYKLQIYWRQHKTRVAGSS